MSEHVKTNSHYFNLLLDTHPAQRKALLLTTSDKQIDLISEIVHNIVTSPTLSAKERNKLGRRSYLKELSNIKRSHAYRRQRVKTFKNQLLKLLDDYITQLRRVAEVLK